MASPCLLRAELHSIVLRGFQRLRDIEIAHEVAEFVLLEARMVVATSLDESYDDEWAPSPEEIVAAREAIQANWSDEEREQRRRSEYTSTRIKRYVADFHHLNDGHVTPETRSDKYKGYRERHRERILAQRQDPAYKEKRREEYRRYMEKNKFRIKERAHAKRDQYNAARKAADDKRRDEVRASAMRRYYERAEIERSQARDRSAARRDEINARRKELYAQKRAAAAC